MKLQRQHFLRSYLKTLSAGPVGVSNSRPPASQPGAQPSEQPVRGNRTPWDSSRISKYQNFQNAYSDFQLNHRRNGKILLRELNIICPNETFWSQMHKMILSDVKFSSPYRESTGVQNSSYIFGKSRSTFLTYKWEIKPTHLSFKISMKNDYFDAQIWQ